MKAAGNRFVHCASRLGLSNCLNRLIHPYQRQDEPWLEDRRREYGMAMSTFVFVHGGWHGGWCWDHLAPLLERAGHSVATPDLPGHSTDHSPVSERPWERYVPTIVDVVLARPEPVVLIGHSSGGMIISAVAREIPDRISALVYLAAFMLPLGTTPGEVMDPSDNSLLPQALRSHPESGTTTIDPQAAREVFYHDCAMTDADWAIARLGPEPIIPRGLSGVVAPHSESSIPRIFVETTEDRALPVTIQRRMMATMPCEAVYTLRAGHSPFLSVPGRLAEVLIEIARQHPVART